MALGKVLSPLKVVALILLVRILSVFLVQTWYVPDEYWQTLEVAHKQAFGYGELTWEWQKGIRSYLYPSVIAVFYWILKITQLDYPEVVVLLPRILQALLSTAADYSFYKWCGQRKWALFLILTSWFWFYTSGRTLLQTLETVLVSIGLSLFPFKNNRRSYYEKENNKWLLAAVISVFIRPTSAPLWLALSIYNIFTTNQGRSKLILHNYLPIGLIVGGSLVALDSFFYGRLIVTPWEFFRFNVLHDVASFYGTHPWHWYLTQGLPAVLGIHLIPVLWAIYNVLQRPKENPVCMLLLIAATLHIFLYSFIAHKEFRFVLPLLPILLYLAQDVIVPWSRKANKWSLYSMATLILAGSVIPSAYFGLVHQAGTLKLMPHLRESLPSNRSSVLFLMPCHSTPLYSHIHANVTARYLHCEPVGAGSPTEAEVFYNNPQRWWRTQHAAQQTPDLLVLFDVLKGRLESLLADYRQLLVLPHTQFPEGEVGENVLVYKRVDKRQTSDDAL